MTADEIRTSHIIGAGLEWGIYEIAAQLAELNEKLERLTYHDHSEGPPALHVMADIGSGGPGSVG